MNDLVFSIVFRIVSFISPNQFIAQQAGGPSVGMALGFAGFLITYNNIPHWLWGKCNILYTPKHHQLSHCDVLFF